MPTTSEVVARVSRLAAGQWGMMTTAQAEREDVTRLHLARLADAGVLERVGRGIYATTSSADDHRNLRAAWLALDPTRTAEERLADPIAAGVVSHTSAAGLHHLGDLLDDEPEITLPHRKQSRRDVRLHRLNLTNDDVTLVDGLPTTTEERTVADLLRDGHDPEQIAQIIGQGVRRGVIDLENLAEHVEPFARSHRQPDGRALVEYLLDLVDLSPTALARDLARSTAGQVLVEAGRMSALSDILASIMPRFDVAQLIGPGVLRASSDLFAGVEISKLAGTAKLVAAFQQGNPMVGLNAELAKIVAGSSAPSAAAWMKSPGVLTAITDASAPSMQAALAITSSPGFRNAIAPTLAQVGDAAMSRIEPQNRKTPPAPTQATSRTDAPEDTK